MNEDKLFMLSGISASNLDLISREQGRSLEMRICELSFIADKIAENALKLTYDGMSANEILTLLSEELSFEAPSPDSGTINEHMLDVAAFLRMITGIDKANFSSLLLSKLKECGINVGEASFLPKTYQEETFTYVKNSLADEAFDVFSQEFSDPRIVYSDSYKEACFAVADGKVGYSILPFEERGGVRIPSIANLVSALDLKIAAITPVFGFEGTADMKYALVERGFKIPERGENTDRYLEINIPKSSELSLGEFLAMAEYLGVSVYRINTMVNDPEGNNAYYSIILKDGGRSFTELLVYLSLFAKSYTPVGIYKNIE